MKMVKALPASMKVSSTRKKVVVKPSNKTMKMKKSPMSMVKLSSRSVDTTKSTDPFLAVVRTIKRGQILSFQDVAEKAGRQGMGGMMRASAVVHAIGLSTEDLPWWRVVYSSPGKVVVAEAPQAENGISNNSSRKLGSHAVPLQQKPLEKLLQKGVKRAKLQKQKLESEGWDLTKALPAKVIPHPDALTVYGRDLISASRSCKTSSSVAAKLLFTNYDARLKNLANWIPSADKWSSESIRVPSFYSHAECTALLDFCAEPSNRDRTVRLDSHNFGRGIYHYLSEKSIGVGGSTKTTSSGPGSASLAACNSPGEAISRLRGTLYELLKPLAIGHFAAKKSKKPDLGAWLSGHAGSKSSDSRNLVSFWELCRKNGQSRSSSLVLYYDKGGENFPHQDLFGSVYFPLQVLIYLSRPGEDFSGGQFFTESDTKKRILHSEMRQGDLLIFDSVNVRHGMTEVTKGRRAVLAFVFHLAK